MGYYQFARQKILVRSIVIQTYKTTSRFLAAWLLLAMLTACGALGIPKAETFNQRLLLAYNSVETSNKIAKTIAVDKKISVADAENLNGRIRDARIALDVAAQVGKINLSDATTRLDAVIVTINAIQAYLDSKGGGQ